MSQLECKVCDCKFNAIVERHYIARDKGKTGTYIVFGPNSEDSLYDAFDCPVCGSQIIVQERKRKYIPYAAKEVEDSNDES